MIIVAGWVRLLDANEVDRFRAAAIEMMRATKAQETGCLEYAFATDLADPALLHVVERWTDQGALSAHFTTPHMALFQREMANARIASMSVKAYSGEVVRTLMER